jgi:hypothetical protein
MAVALDFWTDGPASVKDAKAERRQASEDQDKLTGSRFRNPYRALWDGLRLDVSEVSLRRVQE